MPTMNITAANDASVREVAVPQASHGLARLLAAAVVRELAKMPAANIPNAPKKETVK
ncbi:hypothetical protein [Marivivens aquimaris]|uniref:hypothetical protein n=1 Tax=Marivivens aquimaris TaxID=2774876 RepID=UPI0018829A18|nr:hypothetical protein [Marivivens aquimaris]